MLKIKIDVRQFAVPSPKCGSIETNSGYGSPPLSGQEIHALIQKKLMRQNNLLSIEKPFSMTFDEKKYSFTVTGRADCFINDGLPTIIEIKSSFDIGDLEKKLKYQQDHPYILQLKTYGYFCYKNSGNIPTLKLLLVSSRNIKMISEIIVDFDILAYEQWLERRLKELVVETKIREKLFLKRKALSSKMHFPFDIPRAGQLELVNDLEDAFLNEKPVLVQAATGLGKTVGVLFPTLQEAFKRGQKVIYVTPKNSQHNAAENAVDQIEKRGTKVRRLTINAKSRMCLKESIYCNPSYCEYAHNYYDKISSHDLIAKINKLRSLDPKKFIKIGKEYLVCPFEISLEAIDLADVVIADYNYVFSPRSLLSRLTQPLLMRNEAPNLVIDEAHNLPARAQDYFSPKLSTKELEIIEEQLRGGPSIIHLGLSLVQDLKDLIIGFRNGQNEKQIHIDNEPFIAIEKKLRDFVILYLESGVNVHSEDPVLKLLSICSEFTAGLLNEGEEYFQSHQISKDDEVLKIICADASPHLSLAYKEFKNIVAFSATLKPFEYYLQLLGFPSEAVTLEIGSPFNVLNRKIIMIPQISTKYKDRHFSAARIGEVIKKMVAQRSGNYMALFPSFEFLRIVEKQLDLEKMQIISQRPKMNSQLTESYLREMRSQEKATLLLGVQGGIFSEGVDYPGEMLLGVFIVGPALPNFDFEKELRRQFFEKKYGVENAFDYTYVYPAMARAIQSAGRVIRTENDRGIIVLIDPRFLQKSYYKTMPNEWFINSPQELLSQKILEDLSTFWRGEIQNDT